MSRSRLSRDLAIGLAVFLAYLIAGKLSLRLASVHPSATPVWPPTGIAIAVLLTLGSRFWPAILAGAFVVNLTTAGSVLTCLAIATGNTLEAVLASYFANRYAAGRKAFEKSTTILAFAFFVGLLCTTVAATIGASSLTMGGYANLHQYGLIWRTWWLGDATGALIVTPLLLLWAANPRIHWSRPKFLEALILLSSMLLTSGVIFGVGLHLQFKGDPLTFLCTPFIVWAAFRFGPREAAATVCILCAVSVSGTVRGYGPFVVSTPNTSLLLLQSFLGLMALMSLVFAAEVSERQHQEEQVRHLAVSDPLTGLANYRRLIETLESEIRRHGRTGRSFSVLLLDLDGLKKLNDSHGHVAGSRAICRVANVLRMDCRDTDLPARYGGDEFAVILPEAGYDSTCQVASRVAEHVKNDPERPPISVSFGVAEFPRDGATINQILRAADARLYRHKASANGSSREPSRT